MADIVLLALAAAVFPTLIACVAILLSRPAPRRLLVAFYGGGVLVSVSAGIVVLNAFDNGHAVVGNSSSNPNPGTSIVMGLLALLLGWLMASDRGRVLRNRRRRSHPRRKAENDGPSWAERHLDQANVAVAFAIGAAINLPGPFYILALGEISSGAYSRPAQFGLILLFNAIMFVLIEVPLVGYLLSPEKTAQRVAELAAWLNGNALRVMGALVALVGASLVAQGIVATR